MSKNIENEIFKLVLELKPDIEVSKDIDLKEDLRLDSLDIISFLFDVERATGIKIHEEDIDNFNLFNLGKLIEYLKK
jgi:acyl carrier protein